MPEISPAVSPTGKPLLGNSTIAIVASLVLALEALVSSGLIPAQYAQLAHLAATLAGLALGALSPGWRTPGVAVAASIAAEAKAAPVASPTTPEGAAGTLNEIK